MRQTLDTMWQSLMPANNAIWRVLKRRNPPPHTIKTYDINDDFLRRVIVAVEALLPEGMNDVSTLCQHVGISRTTLHNEIKKRAGLNTTSFVHHVKIKKAQEMLVSSRLSISEIAFKCGYNSPSYFSERFKKITGSSPNSWRANRHSEQ